jgi:hypothetical protein
MFIGHYVFAVDGLIEGGKKTSKTFSTIKSDLSISLKSGYNFHSYKMMGQKRAHHMVMSNSYLTFHRGNVTWGVPYKSKAKVLGKFKTPSKP